jgi:hypothetical protein
MGVRQIKDTNHVMLSLSMQIYCNECGTLNDIAETHDLKFLWPWITKAIPEKKVKTKIGVHCDECDALLRIDSITHVVDDE